MTVYLQRGPLPWLRKTREICNNHSSGHMGRAALNFSRAVWTLQSTTADKVSEFFGGNFPDPE